MTDEVVRILETIVMLLLVILAGLFVRKIKLLDQRTTAKLSTFVVDVAFPALVFTAMLRNVDAQKLAESWYLPVLGASILVFGGVIGYLVSPLLQRDDEPHRGSVAFTIGTPNWLFIPLPIAIALYGEPGERAVLLCNVGALLVFWSAGVWIVRGGKPDVASLRKLAWNPGLLATILGIALALAFPWTQTLETLDVTERGDGAGDDLADAGVRVLSFPRRWPGGSGRSLWLAIDSRVPPESKYDSMPEPLLFHLFGLRLPFGRGHQGMGLGGQQLPFGLQAGE